MGFARSKWKIEQQAGKAESSYSKQRFEESNSYLPHLHMHSFNPELCRRCEPVCSSPDSSTGGKPAVQLCKDGTNPSGRCQFCSALLYMEKQKVSVSPAVVPQPDGLGSFSSPPCVFLGDTAHFSVTSIKTDTPHSWSLLLWTLVRLFSPQVSSKSEVKHVKTI